MTTGRARMIDVDGPVHVVEYGDGGGGPPVVCVHGLGGSAADWQLLAPRLAPRRVYALDLPGFGVSPLGGRTATIQRLRVLLDRFIHEQVGEPVVLVGNSMGGMLALLQAARCRASVDRLVLLSPVVPTPVWRAPHLATVAQFMVYALPVVGEWFVRVRRRRIAPAALVAATLAYIAADVDRIPRSIVDERTALAPRRAGDATGDRAFLAAARSLLALLGTHGGTAGNSTGSRLPCSWSTVTAIDWCQSVRSERSRRRGHGGDSWSSMASATCPSSRRSMRLPTSSGHG